MFRYLPVAMHLHASHEPTAGIGGHIAQAAAMGIRHLFWTEHDVRMGEMKYAIRAFRFRTPEWKQKDEGKNESGFRETAAGGRAEFLPFGDGFSLRLFGGDPGESACGGVEEAAFFSTGKRHCAPLFSHPTVGVTAEFSVPDPGTGGAELFFTLSEQPNGKTAELCFAVGTPCHAKDANRVRLPLPPANGDGRREFRLWELVPPPLGGEDNALCSVGFRVFGDASVTVRGLDFARERSPEETRQAGAAIADALGARAGVSVFTAFEITGAGQHKNCYTTSVPVIDYKARGYAVTEEDAIAHVRSHGGIFGYNHPFTPWKRCELDENGKREALETRARELIETRVHGASLMEVGFPEPKENFETEYYFALWDRLSAAGVFITGDGDSDAHACDEKRWRSGNDFVSFIGVPEDDPGTEASFCEAICAGRLWGGDPVGAGRIRMEAGCAPMGSITVGDRVSVRFAADGFSRADTLLRVTNGTVTKTLPVLDGCVRDEFELAGGGGTSFARYELWGEGRLLAFTNPVYLVKTEEELPDGIAPRRYGNCQ